jgi:mannose-6-phosphate isomerase-like protein (cupin superfamily)
MQKPIIFNAKNSSETFVQKDWGHEIIFENNEKYCGKLLVFKKGASFSMHYHLIKDETWYVQEGEFLFRWIDTDLGKLHQKKITEGDCLRISIGQPHQLESLTGGTIFEVSTEHFDEDSYRVWRTYNSEGFVSGVNLDPSEKHKYKLD